jgi:hypothetical protein
VVIRNRSRARISDVEYYLRRSALHGVMRMSKLVKEWLELYAQGPDLEEQVCRNCDRSMLIDSGDEPTVFCHHCVQEFLPLLVEAHAKRLTAVFAALRELSNA